MNIGKAIRDLRIEKGYSLEGLAEKSLIHPHLIDYIENSKHSLTFSELEKITEALDVSLPVLILMSIGEEDVPKEKREAFKALYPSITGFIKELINE